MFVKIDNPKHALIIRALFSHLGWCIAHENGQLDHYGIVAAWLHGEERKTLDFLQELRQEARLPVMSDSEMRAYARQGKR